VKEYITAKRKLLTEYFEAHRDVHLTAERICADLQKTGEISKSAIYRNLDRMVQEGKLLRTADKEGRLTYQYVAAADCCDHIHMQCTKCGKIFHMQNESAEGALKAALQSSDFEIDSRRTVLYGRCGGCN